MTKMKSASQWVAEQRCPEEWASEKEVEAIQRDAITAVCEQIRAEVIAGAVLIPVNDLDRAWNRATVRACDITKTYKAGKGLFQ